MNHQHFIHRCLELGKQGRGLTGTNPMVGAVLVSGDSSIIAEGYYNGPGIDHAERNLFKNFDQKIQQEYRLYVNLEPCNHHGETPPCTDLIIEKGIKNVIIGMKDPDPRVCGKGIEALRSAGINVVGPVLRAQCERLNRGFITLRIKGRPFITLKRAQTKEGKIANDDGSRLSITSDKQDEWSHTHLRATHDAILVGVNTVIIDNPKLTVRNTKYQIPNTKNVIVLDPQLRTPINSNIVREGTIIIRKDSEESKESKESDELKSRGVRILPIPFKQNQFDFDLLWKALSTIHYPLSSILVEGGQTTWQSFKNAHLVDEEVILVGST